jgi:hypothetical protein
MALHSSFDYNPETDVCYRTLDFMGYPGYRIGDDGSMWCAWVNCAKGRIRRDRWKQMSTPLNTTGYPNLNLVPPEGRSYKTFRVHRLVLLAFVGPPPDGQECRHLNGIRTDARLVNLAWGTKAENAEDRRQHRNYSPRIRLFTYQGRTLPLKEWAGIFGIDYLCLYQRVTNLGMTFEEAITRPYLGTASNGGHWTRLKRAKEQQPAAPRPRH